MTMIEIVYAAFVILFFGINEVFPPDWRYLPLTFALMLAGCGLAGAGGVFAALAAFIWLEANHGK
jgi:hypothetical protein